MGNLTGCEIGQLLWHSVTRFGNILNVFVICLSKIVNLFGNICAIGQILLLQMAKFLLEIHGPILFSWSRMNR